jgi:hypothetical protein
MGKQARNRGIFGAGKDFGECAGYAVNTDGEPVPQYNGMIGVRRRRVASAAFAGVYDANNWEMAAATGAANETLHVLIADETTSATVGGQRFQGLGVRTADMAIPAGLPVRWYVLNAPDFFDIGAENFTNAVGTNRFATISGFDLTAVAAAPASGWYFEIASSRISNIGGSDGGPLYLVDLRKNG